MGFQRLDAKLQARESMRKAYPHPMLVTLVYLFVTTVLVGVIQYIIANPFMNFYSYLTQGYTLDDIGTYYLSLMAGGRGALLILMSLLLSLYASVMGIGYTSYTLRMARNEQPSYRTLLDGCTMVWRVIGMLILQSVFVALWSLLALVPMFGVVTIALMTKSVVLMQFVAIPAYVLAVAWAVAVSYRYRLAAYFLLDDPTCGALESITRSKVAMRRRKGALFALDLSFVGWTLISMMTFGILDLWLAPYQGVTEANFYAWAIGRPVGQQTAPADAPHRNESGPNIPF